MTFSTLVQTETACHTSRRDWRIPAAHEAKLHQHRSRANNAQTSVTLLQGRVGRPVSEGTVKFHVTSMTRPKRVAKSLRKTLADLGHDLSLSSCQEAVARMYGHSDWHALSKATNAQPSPADDEVPEETATERRKRQEEVLSELGIPFLTAKAALDRVRPTGRAVEGDRPQGTPRLLVRAVLTETDGTERDLGLQDLTNPMADDLQTMGLDFVEADIERGLRVYRISGSLSQEARRAVGDPGFKLVDFKEAWERFKSAIGDVADRRVTKAFCEHLQRTGSARRRLDSARETLRVVGAARFVTDASDMEMFAPVDGFDPYDRFHSAPGEAYEGLLYDAYTNEVERRTDADFDSAECRAWHRRYREWEEARTPPVVFGTRPVIWRGLSAQDIREALLMPGEDGHSGEGSQPELDADVGDMIECDLSDNHHEDASDLVVDWEGLSFVDEWLPHAGSGDPVDRGFEGKVAAWNAKQTIVSYYIDHEVVVPVRRGVTKEDAVAWFRKHVEKCREDLQRLAHWEKPVFPDPEPASDTAGKWRLP